MTVFRRLMVLSCIVFLGSTTTTSAQWWRATPKSTPAPTYTNDQPAAWGLTAPTVVTLMHFDATLFEGTMGPGTQNAAVTCASGQCFWGVGLQLPNGASIQALEISACDGDAAKSVDATLFLGPRVPGDPDDIISVSTAGLGPAPGCVVVGTLLPSPATIDNNNNFYAIRIGMPAGTNLEWNQVRIRYRLQVSPAPGTATFNDVPVGHPQRQFIEALVGAGITGGCGGGNYCPDAPVTRGQMAVFLAAALGLHWPF